MRETLARFAIAGLLLPAIAWPGDPVLLASRRGGLTEVISPDTLETTVRIRLPGSVESIASDPLGRRLFVTLPAKETPKTCCALFALDWRSLQLILLLEPALHATPTIDRVLTQRGNIGIEVFDGVNLARLPTIRAPGVYRMQPSPDGRWLAATTQFPSPSLDLFDLVQGNLVRQHAFERGESIHSAWIGKQCYLFSVNEAGSSQLWPVAPDDPHVREPLAVTLPNDESRRCGPVLPTREGAGERLVVYQPFGDKLDWRRNCPITPGGFILVDPKTGAATDRLAGSEHFRQIVASPDGRRLYGLDVGDTQWKQVRLISLDTLTGAIVRVRDLDADVWFLTLGTIPDELKGRLDLRVQ
jgi:hypothetical protein